MHDNRFFLQSFGLFFRYKPAQLITLFVLTLFLGFNQGFTIVLLIPLLGLLDPAQSTTSQNTLIKWLENFLDKTGINTSLTFILAIFALCLISVGVLTYFKSNIQSIYQQEFSYHIRKRLFKKIIASDWTYLNGKSKFNHIQVLTTEVPKMAIYYHYYLDLATKTLFIAAHVTVALMISVSFTLFVLITGSLVFFLLRNYVKKTELLGNANVQSFRNMLKRIDDFWSTVKIAKVHNSEAFYYQKFDETNKEMLGYQNKQVTNRSVQQLLFTLAGVVSLVLVVYVAYAVTKLPLTSLFVMILLFARLFPQFSGVNNDLNAMVSNTGSVRMVLEMDRDIQEHDFEVKPSAERIPFNQTLDINNIRFSYEPKHPIFNHFSEFIPAGKITGIIGKSGCGKTTLIDILTGLLKPEEGFISVDGMTLTPENLPVWRSELGYLPQDSFFIDGTIRENLIWDTPWQHDDEHLHDVLRLVNADNLVSTQKKGLDTYVVNFPYHFSGGERQRLALARVLLRNPRLLLLDEATSSLDPENETQIMRCLLNLKDKVTIVFVTHREGLKQYFDKIIDLNSN